jgi:hypothetical protein
MMRTVFCFGLVLVSACQSEARMPQASADQLRGCWIEFKGKEATTFRWFQDRANPSIFAGEQIDYTPMSVKATDDTAWRIDRRFGTTRLCFADGRARENAFWKISFSDDDLPEQGRWAGIRATNETLIILMSDADGQRVIFNGVRDGCD